MLYVRFGSKNCLTPLRPFHAHDECSSRWLSSRRSGPAVYHVTHHLISYRARLLQRAHVTYNFFRVFRLQLKSSSFASIGWSTPVRAYTTSCCPSRGPNMTSWSRWYDATQNFRSELYGFTSWDLFYGCCLFCWLYLRCSYEDTRTRVWYFLSFVEGSDLQNSAYQEKRSVVFAITLLLLRENWRVKTIEELVRISS